MNQADQIRQHVNTAFFEPARKAGKASVHIVAGDVHSDLGLKNRMPAVCSAIDARKLQDEYRVFLIKRKGPPQSSTVSWDFELLP